MQQFGFFSTDKQKLEELKALVAELGSCSKTTQRNRKFDKRFVFSCKTDKINELITLMRTEKDNSFWQHFVTISDRYFK